MSKPAWGRWVASAPPWLQPARWAVFVPVDLPLLPSSLVAFIVRHAEITGSAVTLASVAGFTQTFPAVLDRAALPWLKAELGAERLGCFSALEAAAAALGEQVRVIAVEALVQSGAVCDPDGLAADALVYKFEYACGFAGPFLRNGIA